MVDLEKRYFDESMFKPLLDQLDKKYGLTEVISDGDPYLMKKWHFKEGRVELLYYPTIAGFPYLAINYGLEPTSDYSGFWAKYKDHIIVIERPIW